VDVLVSRLLITLRAVIYMTGFVLLWGWVAIRVHAFDRGLGVPLPLATRILGVIFMGLGGILAVTCAGVFVALCSPCYTEMVEFHSGGDVRRSICGTGTGNARSLRRSEKFSSPSVPIGAFGIRCTSERSLCWSVLVCTSLLSQSCSCL